MSRLTVRYTLFLIFGIAPVSVLYVTLTGSSLLPALVIGSVCYSVCFLSDQLLSRLLLRSFKNRPGPFPFKEVIIQPAINVVALLPGLWLGYQAMFLISGDPQYSTPHDAGVAVGFSCILLSVAWNLHGFFKVREKALLLEKNALTLDLLQTRLKTLTLQMNPHFLFNALNALISFIGHQPEKAESMALDLSDLLRRVLKASEKELHTLSEELEICFLYIRLQKERFCDLSFDTSVGKEVTKRLAPPMILQPLLENAVNYGAGRISLSIADSGGRTHIVVSNSISPQKSERKKGAGLAQQNIRKRLRLMYDDQASLQCSERKTLYKAEILLPPQKDSLCAS